MNPPPYNQPGVYGGAPPQTFNAAPQQSGYGFNAPPGNPMQQTGYPAQNNGPMGYGAAPPGNFGPPSTSTMPGYSGGVPPPNYGAPMGGPPSAPIGGGMAPPNSGALGPPAGGGGFAQPPKSSVQFFSLAGGAPVPSSSQLAAPPMSAMGPPALGGATGGPSSSAFGTFAPPPGGAMPGPPGGAPASFYPPGAQQQQFQQQGQFAPPAGPPSSGSFDQHAAAPQVGFYNQNQPTNMNNNNFQGNTMSAGMGMGMPPGSGPPGSGGPPNNVPGGQGQPVVTDPATTAATSSPLPLLSELDLSIQCNKDFMRCNVGKMLSSESIANSSRIPLGVIVRPMAGDKGIANDEIDLVDFGSTGIVRCKRCRSYINPYVSWTDNGRRWRCNICGMLNDVPSSYFSHLDNRGFRRDRDQRPELSKCSVEFVAPGDYMVRPPQPPVYFFVIDVSSHAVQTGMIATCVDAIKSSLDDLPGNPRTQIGFITFDSSIHFYNLKPTLKAPQMLVVSDISDLMVPLPEDILVNLQDSRRIVDSLLDSLPSMFASSTNSNSCLGPALNAAKRVIEHMGGKLCVFQTTLPTLGEGALKNRENPRLLGTDKEHQLLHPDEAWYKNTAIECSRVQIAVDTFLFSQSYTDLASIAILSKYSSGSTYFYPAFQSSRDGAKFMRDLEHNLTRATAFEAVMRVRCTRGARITNFYGNYFIRGTDLLALPNCTSDSTFAMDIAYDEPNLSAQVVTVQAALLYTSSSGERRIRVHNMLVTVTNSLAEVVESLDIDSTMNLLAKQAIDIAQKTGFENARQRVHQTAVDILRGARQMNAMSHGADPSSISPSLQLLPLYAMSLQKSMLLRGGTEVRIDERSYYHHLLSNMEVADTRVFIYPRLFSVHDMTSDVGLPSDAPEDEGATAGPFRVRLPSLINLTHERLSSDGIFLLENGAEMIMWIGRAVNPAILNTLFNITTLEGVDMSRLEIQPENSDYSSRVNALVVALRQERVRYMQLHFIREGDGYAEAYFARFLVEDRANFPGGTLSYTEYYGLVMKAMMSM